MVFLQKLEEVPPSVQSAVGSGVPCAPELTAITVPECGSFYDCPILPSRPF